MLKKKYLVIGLPLMVVVLGIIGVLFLRGGATLEVKADAVTLQSTTFAADHAYNFAALDDPFMLFEPTLKEEKLTVKLDGDLVDALLYVTLKEIMIGETSYNDVLKLTLSCGEDYGQNICVFDKDTLSLSYTLEFEEAQAREYKSLIEEFGMRVVLAYHVVEETHLDEYVISTFQQEDTKRIYTEFGRDATTEMIVNYHAEYGRVGLMYIREEGSELYNAVYAEGKNFPFRSERIYQHYLEDLTPDTTYEIHFGNEDAVFKISTMPETLSRELNFVYTGDSRSFNEWFYTLNTIIGELEVDAVIGTGDYVACEGELTPSNSDNWAHFLDSLFMAWTNNDNHITPFLAGWGNHEASSGTAGSNVRHKDYLPLLFSFPNNPQDEAHVGYDYIQFGDYFTHLMLDSFHINDIEPQTAWLESITHAIENSRYIIPVYHTAVYPSQKSFTTGHKVAIREQWLPIFQDLGIQLVMESCDHTYKKSFPIKVSASQPNGYVEEGGMIFLGDGGWGAPLRNVLASNGGQFDPTHESSEYWWVEDAAGLDYNLENSKHFHMVSITHDAMRIRSINSLNEVFDDFTLTP